MKYIWEESDFKRGDRKNTGYPVKNDSNEMSILGWEHAINSNSNHYTLISLRDGMVLDIGELSFAVQYLNQYGYCPIFNTIDIEKLVKER